ncbi:Abi family protein [Enterococcus faecalis]|nr:Abi family protein [Enterococcus faecalis]
MLYDRPAKNTEEQLQILKDRGLRVENDDFAVNALRNIGYFRFKGYCLAHYEQKDVFNSNISFNAIYNSYRFDERIRLILFQIIEHVEVELKSVISQEFALKTGPLGHYDNKNFKDKYRHKSWLNRFETLVEQSAKRRELYAGHYIKKYESEFPVWVATEISDFGSLSKLYSNMNSDIQKDIAKKYYSVGYKYLENWIYLLSVMRNICAHNGRVYDRNIPINAKFPKKHRELSTNKVFAAIYICSKLCLEREYFNMFMNSLSRLIDLYETIELDKIGFPVGWETYLK